MKTSTNSLSHWQVLWASAFVVATTGCGGSSDSSGVSSMEALADQLDAAAAEQAKTDAVQAKADAVTAAQAKADALANQAATEVTEKNALGRRQAKGSGYLGAVAKGYIKAQQEISNIEVISALRTYDALNDGYPKSHEEFMEKVIAANGIALEQLEEPYEYWYNADDHKLYTRVKPEAIAAAQAEADAAKSEATGEPTVVGSLVRDDSGDFELPDGSMVYTWTSGDRRADEWMYLWCDLSGVERANPMYRVHKESEQPGDWKPLLTESAAYEITGFDNSEDDEPENPFIIVGVEKLASGNYVYQVRVDVDGQPVATAGITFDIP